jgi:hypothetical protein
MLISKTFSFFNMGPNFTRFKNTLDMDLHTESQVLFLVHHNVLLALEF